MAAKLKDGLFLGDYESAQDLEFIIANKITHIINCVGKEVPNSWERTGVKYLTFSWPESGNCVIFDENNAVLDDIYAFIEEAHENAESILIHSIDGASRGCFCSAVYFMLKYRWTLNKTLGFLQSKRPDLCPKPGFMRQLRALDASLQRVARGAKKSAAETRRYFDWDPEILSNDHARQNGARPGDYDHDELLVANTYLNSQPQGDPRQLRSMTANGRLRRDRSRGVGRRRVQWIDDPSRKNTAHTDVPRSPRTHRPTAERPPTPSYNSLKPANGWNDTGERNRSHERPQSAHAALISILKNSPKWKEDTKEKQANVRFAIESSSSQEASAVSQISTSTDQSTPTKAAERGQDMPNIFAQNARPKKEHPEISAHKANKYHIPPTPPISSESEGLGDEGYAPEAKARHSDPPIRQYNQQQHHSTSKNARGFSIQGSSSMSSAGMTFPGTERQVSATTRPNSSSATLSSSGRPPKGSSTQHMNGEGVLLSNALHTEGISGRNAGSSGLFRYAGKSSGDNVSLPPSPHGATTQKFFGGEAVAALQNTHSHNNVRSSSVRPSTSENDVHRGRSKQGSNQHSHKRYATPPPRQWGRQERQTRNTSSGGPRPVSASATTHSKSNPALPTQLYLTSHSQLGGSKQDGRGGGDFWPPIGKQSNASNPRTGKVRTGGKLQQQHPIRIAPMPHNNSLHGSAENTTSQLQSNGWRPQSAAARVGPVAVRTTDGYLGLRQDLNAVPKINQASKQGKRRGSPSSNRRSKSSSRTNSPSSGKKPAKGNSRSRLKITTP